LQILKWYGQWEKYSKFQEKFEEIIEKLLFEGHCRTQQWHFKPQGLQMDGPAFFGPPGLKGTGGK
jgi:hypothetical protein